MYVGSHSPLGDNWRITTLLVPAGGTRTCVLLDAAPSLWPLSHRLLFPLAFISHYCPLFWLFKEPVTACQPQLSPSRSRRSCRKPETSCTLRTHRAVIHLLIRCLLQSLWCSALTTFFPLLHLLRYIRLKFHLEIFFFKRTQNWFCFRRCAPSVVL